MADRDYCKEMVHQGRMGMFSCTRKPTGPDGLCTQHRAAKAGPDRTELEPAGEPEIETSHRASVTLRWAPGQGPVSVPPHGQLQVFWLTISTSFNLPLERRKVRRDRYLGVRGVGVIRKKDGTPGDKTVEARFMDVGDIPLSVREQFIQAVLDADREV